MIERTYDRKDDDSNKAWQVNCLGKLNEINISLLNFLLLVVFIQKLVGISTKYTKRLRNETT